MPAQLGTPPASALALAAAYRSDQTDPVAVVDMLLERVAALDAEVGAFVTVTADEARAAALSARDALRGSGEVDEQLRPQIAYSRRAVDRFCTASAVDDRDGERPAGQITQEGSPAPLGAHVDAIYTESRAVVDAVLSGRRTRSRTRRRRSGRECGCRGQASGARGRGPRRRPGEIGSIAAGSDGRRRPPWRPP